MSRLTSRLSSVAATCLVVFGGLAIAQTDAPGSRGDEGRTGPTPDNAQTVPQPVPPSNLANPDSRADNTTSPPASTTTTTTTTPPTGSTGTTSPGSSTSGSTYGTTTAPGSADTGSSTGTSGGYGSSGTSGVSSTDSSLAPRTDRN